MDDIFVITILRKGGRIFSLPGGGAYSVCNPSVFLKDKELVYNLRKVNYVLENHRSGWLKSAFGDCNYHHPCNDMHLRTYNSIFYKGNVYDIDTFAFDKEPKWDFVGLEDGRLVEWDGKLFLCGCRRDTAENGQSRMELSELDVNTWKEISRTRIPAPDENSYCEKNWMPVLDLPYTFVKWSNPTEVVRYDPEKNITETVALVEQSPNKTSSPLRDLRGSTQVIKVEGKYYSIVHEVDLSYTRYKERSAKYKHRILCWDEKWNLLRVSESFSFFPHASVEFTCGLSYNLEKSEFIIPFAIMDGVSYVLTVPENVFFSFLWSEDIPEKPLSSDSFFIDSPLKELLFSFLNSPEDPLAAENLGIFYYESKEYCSAFIFYHIAAELYLLYQGKSQAYTSFWMCQQCLLQMKGREPNVYTQLFQVVELDPERPEAWFDLALLSFTGARNSTHNETCAFIEMAQKTKHNWKGYKECQEDREYFYECCQLYQALCAYRMCRDYEAKEILSELYSKCSNKMKNQIVADFKFILG